MNALVPGSVDVSAVPPCRLLGLATLGLSGRVSQLRRMPREHLLAVLVATIFTLRANAVDDVLEVFDQVMVNDLISKAERQSKDEKLRRYPRGRLTVGADHRPCPSSLPRHT